MSFIHNFVRRVTSSKNFFPAAPLDSSSSIAQSFHMHCLSPFRKYFPPPNSSKTFLEFQSYLEYHCRCYCCCYWYYHCCHRLLLLFGCRYWLSFFFGRSLVRNFDWYGSSCADVTACIFFNVFAYLLMMQIYFVHDMTLLVVNVCFVLLCDIERFKHIKRNTLETFLLTLNPSKFKFFFKSKLRFLVILLQQKVTR